MSLVGFRHDRYGSLGGWKFRRFEAKLAGACMNCQHRHDTRTLFTKKSRKALARPADPFLSPENR